MGRVRPGIAQVSFQSHACAHGAPEVVSIKSRSQLNASGCSDNSHRSPWLPASHAEMSSTGAGAAARRRTTRTANAEIARGSDSWARHWSKQIRFPQRTSLARLSEPAKSNALRACADRKALHAPLRAGQGGRRSPNEIHVMLSEFRCGDGREWWRGRCF